MVFPFTLYVKVKVETVVPPKSNKSDVKGIDILPLSPPGSGPNEPPCLILVHRVTRVVDLLVFGVTV